MRLSEFIPNPQLRTADELYEIAKMIADQIAINGDLKLITNDNLDDILDKYLDQFYANDISHIGNLDFNRLKSSNIC